MEESKRDSEQQEQNNQTARTSKFPRSEFWRLVLSTLATMLVIVFVLRRSEKYWLLPHTAVLASLGWFFLFHAFFGIFIRIVGPLNPDASLQPGIKWWMRLSVLESFLLAAILGIISAVSLPSMLKARTPAKCTGSIRNWEKARDEAQLIVQSIEQSNMQGLRFTAENGIQNVIWRHTGIGNCMDLPGKQCASTLHHINAPFNAELPALVNGIDNIVPNSGQVALEVDPNDPMAVIVYRDLSWEPICGETAPVQTTVRAGE